MPLDAAIFDTRSLMIETKPISESKTIAASDEEPRFSGIYDTS